MCNAISKARLSPREKAFKAGPRAFSKSRLAALSAARLIPGALSSSASAELR